MFTFASTQTETNEDMRAYPHALLLLPLLFLLPAFTACRAQSLEGGARSVALGGALTAASGDVWGDANPASWGTVEDRSISLFTSRGFLLPELDLVAAIVVQPTPAGHFSAHARTFGYENFRESHFDIGYARGIRPGTRRPILIGIRLQYHLIQIKDYESAGAISVTTGGIYQVIENLSAGFTVTNLTAATLPSGESLEQSFSLGLAYTLADRLALLADFYKDVLFPPSVRAGVEVAPATGVILRTGVTTAPTRFTAGAGIRTAFVDVDLAIERHLVLGWSPALSLTLVGW